MAAGYGQVANLDGLCISGKPGQSPVGFKVRIGRKSASLRQNRGGGGGGGGGPPANPQWIDPMERRIGSISKLLDSP